MSRQSPFQFSLAWLFVFVTACTVLFALSRWIGLAGIAFSLLVGGSTGAAYGTLWQTSGIPMFLRCIAGALIGTLIIAIAVFCFRIEVGVAAGILIIPIWAVFVFVFAWIEDFMRRRR